MIILTQNLSNHHPDPTLTEIKLLIIEDFDYRISLGKEWYQQDGFREGWPGARIEIMRWCIDRFGLSALGAATNRDDRGFYKNTTSFPDPDVARFSYNAAALWVARGFMFRFKEEDAAFEFKMRWRGVTSTG